MKTLPINLQPVPFLYKYSKAKCKKNLSTCSTEFCKFVRHFEQYLGKSSGMNINHLLLYILYIIFIPKLVNSLNEHITSCILQFYPLTRQ